MITTEELHAKHKDLLTVRSDPRQPYSMFGIEAPSGWNDLLDCLMTNIEEYCVKNQVRLPVVIQIKEKFGGLRFYADYADENVRALIGKAESESYHTCQRCGSEDAKESGSGWIVTLCSPCAERREKMRKEADEKYKKDLAEGKYRR